MKIKMIAVSDLHADRGVFDSLLSLEDKYSPDMILFGGDLGRSFDYRWLKELKSKHYLIYGNDDDMNRVKRLSSWLHNGYHILYGLSFLVFNGNMAYTRRYPHHLTHKEVLGFIQEYIKDKKDVDIVLAHEPPKGYCDKMDGRGGSHSMLALLKVVLPRLFICGHVKSSVPIESYEGSLVVNVNRYPFVIEWNNGNLRIMRR